MWYPERSDPAFFISVGLDLQSCPGTFALQWVNIQTGDWGPKADLSGGQIVTITAPAPGPWAAAITKKG